MKSDLFGSAQGSFDEFASIEAMIRDASQYVVPSDDLRPRVLESARELRDSRRTLLGFVLAASFLFAASCFAIPMLEKLNRSEPTTSSSMIEKRAREITADSQCGLDWGLVQSFQEWQHSKAKRLGTHSSSMITPHP